MLTSKSIRTLVLLFTLVISSLLSNAQRLRDLKALRNETRRFTEDTNSTDSLRDAFLKFYIPSAILLAGLEPAANSKLNLAFGDDKIDFKVGTVLGKKDGSQGELKNSIGLTLSAAAPEGARSLFKFDKTPRDFNTTVTFTNLRRHQANYRVIGRDTVYVSRKASWINGQLTVGNSKRILFQNDLDYTENHYTNFTFLLNWNYFFNGWLPILSKKRWINSFGIGVGHFDNYDDLDDYTLRIGSISTGGEYFGESESVAGKTGQLERRFGLLVTASSFKPLTKFDAMTSVMAGININSFGLGTSNHYLNSNAGFYVSKRSFDTESGELKEDFSFGMLADFSDVGSWGKSGYFKSNFKVLITAQIPLRFAE